MVRVDSEMMAALRRSVDLARRREVWLDDFPNPTPGLEAFLNVLESVCFMLEHHDFRRYHEEAVALTTAFLEGVERNGLSHEALEEFDQRILWLHREALS